MKRQIIIIAAVLLCGTALYSQPVKLYLGARGGAGAMITRNQLNNVGTPEGIRNVFDSRDGWSTHFKGEALLGLGRIRLGYQFLYNFSTITSSPTYVTTVDGSRYTTYFNGSPVHFFGHYFLTEVALVNTKHFALVPGLALGSYNGFKVDRTTGERVKLSQDTRYRFSLGTELNAELIFGPVTFLVGPNYYFFSMRDKANPDWREYQHFIGADVGLRVNLLK